MIKIDYNFITKGPLHTGSDENTGTIRMFRRQKSNIINPVIYETRLSDEQRRDAVLRVMIGVWFSIDFDKIKGSRLMGIWGEFSNKLLAAARVNTKQHFLNTLCRS